MPSTDNLKKRKSSVALSAETQQLPILNDSNGPSAPRSGRSQTSSANQFRKTLPTAEAAAALNRKPQTLRKWACLENGPIRPVRINGRLAWHADEIAALLNGGSK